MTTEDTLPDDDEPVVIDEAAIRQKATIRSNLCPGAGFALVGRPYWGMATFAATIAIPTATAWLAAAPSTASLATTLAVAGLAVVLWLIEQVVVRKGALGEASPPLLVGGFVLAAGLAIVATLVTLVLILTAYGSSKIAGSGMTPTLRPDERVLYYKHIDRQLFQPGNVIMFRNSEESAWGQPGELVVARVIAGPGDTMTLHGGRYCVDEVEFRAAGQTANLQTVLEIPRSPDWLTVPEGSYFVVQDSPHSGCDSRVFSWVRAENLISAKMWYVSERGILEPVE